MSVIITATDLGTSLPGVSVDSGLASQTVDAVNAYVERVTHRCWGETKTITETYDWDNSLWLSHQDVTAVLNVSLGWPGQTALVLPSNSFWFNSRGRVTIFWQAFQRRSRRMVAVTNDFVSVTYSYGNPNIPDDLRMAAIGVAIGMYNWAAAGGHEVVETSVGSYRVMYAGAVRGASGAGRTSYNNQAQANFDTINSYATVRV